MAKYYNSDSTYGRTYDRRDPAAYGRSSERADPSFYGRGHESTDHTFANGERGYESTDNSRDYGGSHQTYPAPAHSAGWSATKEYGTSGGNWPMHTASPAYDRLTFDERVTKVAREYIQPRRSDSSASMYQRSSSPSKYGGYSAKESYKLSGHNYDSFSRNEYNDNSAVPTYASNGMSKLSFGGYSTSSAHHSASQLSNATNDIGSAVHYLDEAARTTAPGSQIADSTSKIHPYVHKGKNVEPTKRYGTYKLFGRP